MQVASVLLAAGASRRFGAAKLLADVGGEPLVRRTARALLHGGAGELVVVLGARAEEVGAALLDLPSVRTLTNTDWERGGMFSSVLAGLRAVPVDAPRVAVCPGDLPYLATEDVARIFDRSLEAAPGMLVVAAHGGRRGHPLVLDAGTASLVRAWPTTRRLSDVLREPGVHVVEVACGPGVLHDVDVPADLVSAP